MIQNAFTTVQPRSTAQAITKPRAAGKLLSANGRFQTELTQPPHFRTGDVRCHDPEAARARLAETEARATLIEAAKGRRNRTQATAAGRNEATRRAGA